MKLISISIFFYLYSLQLFAQELYQPRNIKQAFQNQTRSKDGLPGKKYFQNKASYEIDLDLTPPKKIISGIEKIDYLNNSTDTLSYLMLRLIQNIHKPGSIRYVDALENYITQGLTIDEMKVNGKKIEFEQKTVSTLLKINLNKPLNPKSQVALFIRWHYEIGTESAEEPENGREGIIDSTTYFLGYSYPKICVYDDIDGWDNSEFTDLQEFYSDFNDYKVSIKVPQNFIVWGTGDLQNPSEVLQAPYLKKLESSYITPNVIHILSQEDYKTNTITQPNPGNVWKFESNHIQDVAYIVSNHFLWDASSTLVDPIKGRRASVQTVYKNAQGQFKNMTRWASQSLNWLSTHLPGVPYPFPKMILFEGFADMEFPMVVNDLSHEDSLHTRRVGAGHEVAHTWFPFYMGINETRYAFMDEGWAQFFESSLAETFTPKKDAKLEDKTDAEEWNSHNLEEADMPIITPSTLVSGEAYQLNSYTKPMLAYKSLKNLLGEDLFKVCLKGYIERWKGKHPLPWDFFNTFNALSGKNLNYFWQAWFFEKNYIDLGISSVKKNLNETILQIRNLGGVPIPFEVKITFKDGSQSMLTESTQIWSPKNNSLSMAKEVKFRIKTNKTIKSIDLDAGIFDDANEENNRWINK